MLLNDASVTPVKVLASAVGICSIPKLALATSEEPIDTVNIPSGLPSPVPVLLSPFSPVVTQFVGKV